jgi:hypothetical protein
VQDIESEGESQKLISFRDVLLIFDDGNCETNRLLENRGKVRRSCFRHEWLQVEGHSNELPCLILEDNDLCNRNDLPWGLVQEGTTLKFTKQNIRQRAS